MTPQNEKTPFKCRDGCMQHNEFYQVVKGHGCNCLCNSRSWMFSFRRTSWNNFQTATSNSKPVSCISKCWPITYRRKRLLLKHNSSIEEMAHRIHIWYVDQPWRSKVIHGIDDLNLIWSIRCHSHTHHRHNYAKHGIIKTCCILFCGLKIYLNVQKTVFNTSTEI
jgi:hypothetical protein